MKKKIINKIIKRTGMLLYRFFLQLWLPTTLVTIKGVSILSYSFTADIPAMKKLSEQTKKKPIDTL